MKFSEETIAAFQEHWKNSDDRFGIAHQDDCPQRHSNAPIDEEVCDCYALAIFRKGMHAGRELAPLRTPTPDSAEAQRVYALLYTVLREEPTATLSWEYAQAIGFKLARKHPKHIHKSKAFHATNNELIEELCSNFKVRIEVEFTGPGETTVESIRLIK